MAKCMIMRRGGGGAAGGFPNFTYTGTYSLIDDGDKNWRIKFLTSGTFTPEKDVTIDVFVVGGGAGGGRGAAQNVGGAGGRTSTATGNVLQKDGSYSIVVGAGGGPNASGGKSWAINESLYYADGGVMEVNYSSGGSGGGGYNDGTGGTNGGNGSGSNAGSGQGTTTKEFGEVAGALYAGGGGGGISGVGGAGGGANSGQTAVANTGGGGGGSISTGTSGAGGSGIVIFRNHRA